MSKSSSKNLSNSWELVFQFMICLEENKKTPVYIFITEILWQTFWHTNWQSVFDIVKILRYYDKSWNFWKIKIQDLRISEVAEIWDRDWIFARAVKAISSMGVRSSWNQNSMRFSRKTMEAYELECNFKKVLDLLYKKIVIEFLPRYAVRNKNRIFCPFLIILVFWLVFFGHSFLKVKAKPTTNFRKK